MGFFITVDAKMIIYYVFFFIAGKIPFIHVGNQVVSELGPIVQFTKAKVSNTIRYDYFELTDFISLR